MDKHSFISNSSMKRFVIKILLFFFSFVMFVIGTFVILDPFRIVWHYDEYYKGTRIGINRGFVSTMVYINQKDKYNYDSFIFGNSRSIAYYEDEWKKYIPQNSSVFHFDASGGSVAGLYYKVKYIDEHGGKLKNALLILDHDLLGTTERTGDLFRTAPELEGYKNLFPFLKDHFEAFTTYDFIYALIDFYLSNEYKDYMGKYITKRDSMVWHRDTNEERWDFTEREIEECLYYTEERMRVFENCQHPDSIALPIINEERKVLLRKTAQVFKKHNTSVKIVISPLYDQIQFNSKDLSFLRNTFGKDRVFDFSGPNKWNSDYRNFYEQSHYRPCVANDILKIIYGSSK